MAVISTENAIIIYFVFITCVLVAASVKVRAVMLTWSVLNFLAMLTLYIWNDSEKARILNY